ncbi:MAG: hypothetical protein ABI867_29500 [Kofleriaceae bacterium]
MSFTEIAEQRLVRSLTGHLDALTWDVRSDGHQDYRPPGTVEVAAILPLLVRRGLDPALASHLLDRFAARPLERALIAWDIAGGSLLGTGDRELAQRLPAALAPLKQLGTSTDVAVHRDRIGALIEAATAASSSAMPEVPSLAAATVMDASDAAGIEAVLRFAAQLALAHLPSLALAFVQILWTRLALPEAIDRLIEIAIDHDYLDAIPVMADQDCLSIQRQTYLIVRASLERLDTSAAAQYLEQLSTHPAVVGAPPDPRLIVAAADLALQDGEPFTYTRREPIAAIVSASQSWRYASRVNDGITMRIDPADAGPIAEGFLMSFGNELRLWAHAALHDQVRAELLALVSREIRYCSHDPEVWRGLALFLDDGTPVEVELRQRLTAQLETALA